MFRRKQVVQDKIIARNMQRFFRTLSRAHRQDPEMVAKLYGQSLWDVRNGMLTLDHGLLRSKSCFTVDLSSGSSVQDFNNLTKRAALISDTLLLSHDGIRYGRTSAVRSPIDGMRVREDISPRHDDEWEYTKYWMCCPSFHQLGRWILDAEPLLKAGLVWYHPSYEKVTTMSYNGPAEPVFDEDEVYKRGGARPTAVIDYLIRDGRAVDASGAEPIKSQLIRPVLQIDLPFIEGVNLQNFSKITIEEFAGYCSFRRCLRQSFLDMDMALNAVQSDRELLKLSFQIEDQVHSVRTEMEKARRNRALGVTGAVIGSVGAILVAVYGPALAAAIATIGATGGVWAIIDTIAKNSPRAVCEDKWYYVWALDTKSITPVR